MRKYYTCANIRSARVNVLNCVAIHNLQKFHLEICIMHATVRHRMLSYYNIVNQQPYLTFANYTSSDVITLCNYVLKTYPQIIERKKYFIHVNNKFLTYLLSHEI